MKMSETMDVDEREEQSDNTNNSSQEYVITNTVNSDELIETQSNAPSDTTHVDENEIHNIQHEFTNLSELTQKSTTSLSNEDSSSCKSPSKKRRFSEVPIEDEDSQTCPICLDCWTTSGDHRLCSLKCGHLFGYSCIKRWLESESKKSCPTCKKKIHLHDIRYIYARKVIAMDTTELTIAKQKLENSIEEKNRVQIELSKAICKVHTLTHEVEMYKLKLSAAMYTKPVQNEYSSRSLPTSTETVYLYKEKTLDLGKNSSCRVFDSKSCLDVVAISMKSPINLCPGFGIKILNLNTFKPTALIMLHTQTIRDVKFHETEPWLLSCSIDKKIKIFDVNTNTTSTTFESNYPLWSCCWDMTHDRILYVGQQQGSVLKFDMRQPSQPVCVLSIEGDYSPVVSVQTVKSSCSGIPFEGVVSCKLNSVWVFQTPHHNRMQEQTQYPLPLDGPFISMTYHKENDHLFLSTRPNSRCSYGRHILCGLNKQGDNINCDIVHTFRGSTTQKMLSRTCFVSNQNDYVAAYIQNQQTVCLWNINTGNRVGSIPAHDSIFDLNSVRRNCDSFLLSLTESKLEFFKFTN